MDTGAEQYGNHNLYFYPDSRSVCHYSDTFHYRESEHHANIQSCCCDLFRGYFDCPAHNINQWHHRNLGACTEQYGNHNLYFYPDCRSVCHHNDTIHYRESEHHADIQSGCCDLFRCYFDCPAHNIDQRHHRNLGTCAEQYGNHNLYFYTDSRSVCHHSDTFHYRESEHHANI